MKLILLLVLLATAASSCAPSNYTVQTKAGAIDEYRIVSVRDNEVIVLPWKYRGEATPETIREYAKVIPADSLVMLRRPGSSGLGEFFLGALIGVFAGEAVGAGTYSAFTHYPDGWGTFGAGFIGGTIGFVSGGVTGAILSPKAKNMLPVSLHLEELRASAIYEEEPDWLKQIQ